MIRLHVIFGLGLFFAYLGVLLMVPLGLLWSLPGIIFGFALTLGLIAKISLSGMNQIGERLHAKPKSRAQNPQIHRVVEEYSRRLGINCPKIAVIDSPSVNFALYGFSLSNCSLAITQGALDRLEREKLSALIGWKLTYLWHGDVVLETWLSQFLALMDPFVTPSFSKDALTRGRLYSLRLFLRQALIYPFTLFPVWVLRNTRNPKTIDLKAVKLVGNPKALSEAFRTMEAVRERIPLFVAYSTRHLFFLPPTTNDPLMRMFFSKESLSDRIELFESLRRTSALA